MKQNMAHQSTTSVDPYEQVGLLRNPDGTITRIPHPHFPEVPATGDTTDSDILTKDVPLNTANATSIRIFRPSNATKDSNLPLIIFYHGGGFIRFSAACSLFHNLCVSIVRELSAVIVSVDYRLGPEHRLPAAFEDAVEAVMWVKNQASDETNGEPWLRDYVDFSKCFITGMSAGGTMVYHAALRLWGLGAENLLPVKIRGLILMQPFFGSVERTASQLRLINDVILPLSSADLMWELSLPSGADRDHEYCNPMVKGLSEWEIEALNSQKCMVCVSGEDPLVDKQKEFMKMLEESGVKFASYFDQKAHHGVEIATQDLFEAFRDFFF